MSNQQPGKHAGVFVVCPSQIQKFLNDICFIREIVVEDQAADVLQTPPKKRTRNKGKGTSNAILFTFCCILSCRHTEIV